MHCGTTHHHSSLTIFPSPPLPSSLTPSPSLPSPSPSLALLTYPLCNRRKPKPRPRRVKNPQIRIEKHVPINILAPTPDTLQTPKTTTSARRSKIHQTAWNSSVGCAADFETVGWEGRAAGEDVAALGGGVFCS